VHADSEVRRFDMFSSITEDYLAWWPLCYIACILELFPSVVDIKFSDIMNDHLCAYAASEETGVDWKLIVKCALLLRCIDAKVNGNRGPFDIAEADAHPDVMCMKFPAELNTLDLAMTQIQAVMEAQQRATVAIFFTSGYAKFPDYDGLVAYRSIGGGLRVFGYQCKLNRAYPKRDATTGVVQKSVLLRGNASLTDNQKRGWEYCSKERIIKDVLCYSLVSLYPADWNPILATDKYD